MITFTTAKSKDDLIQILELQRANLKMALSFTEYKKDGFVTLEHDLESLNDLNDPYPHIIAKDGTKIIGYALVTIPEKITSIPLLQGTIEELEGEKYDHTEVLDLRYFIMGQVCIEKSFRGQGVFQGLYQKMKEEMMSDFDIIITEIATSNSRSMKAHEKVGFEILKKHHDNEAEWAIVILNLR